MTRCAAHSGRRETAAESYGRRNIPRAESRDGWKCATENRRERMNRIEKIEAMLAEDPGDSFLRYSLAMELRGQGEHEKSLARLNELISDDPPMVPAFFMAAQQLVELDRVDEARRHLRNGIDQARAQGDSHAAAEMSELLSSLGELGEL